MPTKEYKINETSRRFLFQGDRTESLCEEGEEAATALVASPEVLALSRKEPYVFLQKKNPFSINLISRRREEIGRARVALCSTIDLELDEWS